MLLLYQIFFLIITVAFALNGNKSSILTKQVVKTSCKSKSIDGSVCFFFVVVNKIKIINNLNIF
jgi:hypothetical protein